MFHSFFFNQKWRVWAIGGSLLILLITWYKVELDVQINQWFGDFYNAIQEILKTPNSVSFPEFLTKIFTFARIAAIYIALAIALEFFVRHYIFRWRTAMTDYYIAHWQTVRHIEGASQRIQEDTMRFARIMQDLGVSFLRSVMTLAAFLPMLRDLSKNVTQLPWIGHVEGSLVYIALLFAILGTVVLAVVGIKLPGLEFNNQKVEAAFRKELVLGEDHADRAQAPTLRQLFDHVRQNHYRLYLHYLYFDLARWSYLQFAVVVPYIALGPSLIMGVLTLGAMQQIVRAFGKVQDSFQYLVHSWSTIVELLSIYKRLKAFEQVIRQNR
ncbi:MAG: putative transporter [Alysiella sp.]|uniref:putative transporter n=1 Tax=Alysiella sp. TaxID=1872483 RepID=UPI0026DC8518|nr:putative transporter [Alysiella sp.]MDO4434312.1 putative transporter [Alysiella sp.]